MIVDAQSLRHGCRWVFWGGPALVHPETGVVFAIGTGTIGIVFRLPPHVIASADPQLARVVQKFNRAPTFDIGPAGPEWRVIAHEAPPALLGRAADDFAPPAAPPESLSPPS